MSISNYHIGKAKYFDTDILTSLAIKSKSFWNYDKEFIKACLPYGTPKIISGLKNVTKIGHKFCNEYNILPRIPRFVPEGCIINNYLLTEKLILFITIILSGILYIQPLEKR